MPAPYLSIVLAVRNDNYGGDFETRLQNAVNWMVYFGNKFKLNAEVVLVSYNPVSDRKPISEAVIFPVSEFISFRQITVPQIFHEKISLGTKRKRLPFYEYIAKNIGVRRAKGRFILSANPDVLIDPRILKFLSEQKLDEGAYYRCNRADYSGNILVENPEENIAEVRKNVHTVFMKGYRHTLTNGFSLVNMLVLMAKNKLKLAYNQWLFRHEDFANRYSLPVTYDYISLKIHANCSGDFMLMHRNSWSKLKGHPEDLPLPIHTDAITVAMAYFSGLKENVFFYPAYHQDHDRRFTADNSVADIREMFRRFEDDGKQMEKKKEPIIYNNDDWGFADEQFEEQIL